MGKVLQIRVSAVTWDEDLLEEYWPKLAKLAFGVPIKFANKGLLEMVRGLSEGLEFVKWPGQLKTALAPGIREAAAIRADLEKALADWEPSRANALSDKLEDCLDRLERAYTA